MSPDADQETAAEATARFRKHDVTCGQETGSILSQ